MLIIPTSQIFLERKHRVRKLMLTQQHIIGRKQIIYKVHKFCWQIFNFRNQKMSCLKYPMINHGSLERTGIQDVFEGYIWNLYHIDYFTCWKLLEWCLMVMENLSKREQVQGNSWGLPQVLWYERTGASNPHSENSIYTERVTSPLCSLIVGYAMWCMIDEIVLLFAPCIIENQRVQLIMATKPLLTTSEPASLGSNLCLMTFRLSTPSGKLQK